MWTESSKYFLVSAMPLLRAGSRCQKQFCYSRWLLRTQPRVRSTSMTDSGRISTCCVSKEEKTPSPRMSLLISFASTTCFNMPSSRGCWKLSCNTPLLQPERSFPGDSANNLTEFPKRGRKHSERCSMQANHLAADELVARYFDLFVNR